MRESLPWEITHLNAEVTKYVFPKWHILTDLGRKVGIKKECVREKRNEAIFRPMEHEVYVVSYSLRRIESRNMVQCRMKHEPTILLLGRGAVFTFPQTQSESNPYHNNRVIVHWLSQRKSYQMCHFTTWISNLKNKAECYLVYISHRVMTSLLPFVLNKWYHPFSIFRSIKSIWVLRPKVMWLSPWLFLLRLNWSNN